MLKTIIFSGILVFSFMWSSCKKDPSPVKIEKGPTTAPSLVFNFTAFANKTVLETGTKKYINVMKDTFTVTKFNYYISNVKLKMQDGTVFSEPESYHLIRHAEGNTSFTVSNLPEGNYTDIEFLIGVDSLRNVSGAQTGDLATDKSMFWEWNTGYIFFKLEGFCVTNDIPSGMEYAIHIGGFSGENSCLQSYTSKFTTPVIAEKNKQSTIFYKVLVDEIFTKPYTIGFDTYYSSIDLKMFKRISLNYKDMFVIDKVEN